MKNDGNKFTVGGLFSGVGGIELGFKEAGFKNIKLPNISDAQLYKQAGNSVTVPLIKKLAVNIRKSLEAN